eukprot:TRINITY_DN2674_c0_g1_i1.p1 TRINITY_DN2674_c0_g1~~TRINITY_DN2674_c0_g1_i1.p1  ORF type:complete len:326 (-),score=19.99 TRINITY_DN2674_c0_g1_i1:1395-2273(-)
MSVYSGFATRHQEDVYNKLLSKAISLMADKIASCKDAFRNHFFQYRVEEDPEFEQFSKVYKYMKTMENYKYLEPKFSHYMRKVFKRKSVTSKKLEQKKPSIIFSKPVTILANTSVYANTNNEEPSKPSIAKIGRKTTLISKMTKRPFKNLQQQPLADPTKRLAQKCYSTSVRSRSNLKPKKGDSTIVFPSGSSNNKSLHSHKPSIAKGKEEQITLEDYFDYLDQISQRKGSKMLKKANVSARGCSLMSSLCDDSIPGYQGPLQQYKHQYHSLYLIKAVLVQFDSMQIVLFCQ